MELEIKKILFAIELIINKEVMYDRWLQSRYN